MSSRSLVMWTLCGFCMQHLGVRTWPPSAPASHVATDTWRARRRGGRHRGHGCWSPLERRLVLVTFADYLQMRRCGRLINCRNRGCQTMDAVFVPCNWSESLPLDMAPLRGARARHTTFETKSWAVALKTLNLPATSWRSRPSRPSTQQNELFRQRDRTYEMRRETLRPQCQSL